MINWITHVITTHFCPHFPCLGFSIFVLIYALTHTHTHKTHPLYYDLSTLLVPLFILSCWNLYTHFLILPFWSWVFYAPQIWLYTLRVCVLSSSHLWYLLIWLLGLCLILCFSFTLLFNLSCWSSFS